MKTISDSAVLLALTDRLRAVRPDSQRRWGSMTAHEMLCHLGDSAEMVLRIRPRERPISVRQRPILKWIGLWTPIRWPHGAKTSPRLDPRVGGTQPSDFAADLERLVAATQKLAAAGASGLEPVHGMLGDMSLRDWQRWAYKHTDYHLRQFGV